ncbi:MAG: D-amino-acid transaminase [Alphaproteobacteria bacterium]
MSRIAYVNGRYLPHHAAEVHIEDRGYQFADGVYEVAAASGGRLVDGAAHFDRLERSLGELDMAMPMSRAALRLVVGETLRRNAVRDGIVYLQVTRGVAPRNHGFPKNVRPALVVTARRLRLPSDAESVPGIKVISQPDIRWGRCDIKSIALLPNVLAMQRALEADAFESWMIDGKGYVTEASSANAWIVDRDGRVTTRPKSNAILGGITRESVIRLAEGAGIELVERPFTIDEARAAREAFITSTTSFVKPVVQIDESVIGNGEPGAITRRLLGLYLAYARNEPEACV